MVGLVIMLGAYCAVSVPAAVVVLPCEFVKTARYFVPLCSGVVPAILSVVDVAPAMSL